MWRLCPVVALAVGDTRLHQSTRPTLTSRNGLFLFKIFATTRLIVIDTKSAVLLVAPLSAMRVEIRPLLQLAVGQIQVSMD